MVFRATKGNSILYTFSTPKYNPSIEFDRTAFIIIIESGSALINKLNRICDSFGINRYTLPTDKDEVFDKIKEI